ncbi:F-box/FBD/LRR-repeat protein At1g13570-like [Ipomoea triloba]|uniref:F-box/FBD/LRR-repeat protein At1g13570-like n=1 Tax=Ipomoea triloba TaxID=35885 RepID=UPI00125D7514|nr:F-box/FBD/LRR-repeat protein At1g13570-like [Ipomoea triloba]
MEISRNNKQRTMEDVFNKLPTDVLNCILDHLPVRDAARTSILSRKWRYIWAGHPNLVLNPKNIVTSSKNDFVGIVNDILLQHTGPILTFGVDISLVDMTRYPNIDLWILYLSRNGLRDLTVENSSPDLYALPSYVFLCQELTVLDLSNCIFKQPCGTIRSFQNLKQLYLTQVAFKPEVSASIFTASKLWYLGLTKCTGIDHLNFEVESLHRNERINLTSLFEHWTQISKLTLDGHHLKLLAAGSVTSALPVKVNSLRELILFGINFTDLEQISCILCLLHSSPGVHSPQIWAAKIPSVTASDNLALQYLQEHSGMSEDINSLQTLMIKFFQGSRVEILFVKLILSCCSSLERITFVDNKVLPSEVSNILKELLLFPRASRKAQIVF